MTASGHSRVWLAAAHALRDQVQRDIEKDAPVELAATTITAYKLAYTVGTAYKVEAENAPNQI